MALFKQATKTQSRARITIAGPSGSGKTLTGLFIAQGIAGEEGRIAVVDTENGSASKYSDLVDFDVLELEPPYHPKQYIKAIDAAVEEGYSVLVVDSLSHVWKGEGGFLAIVDKVTKRSKSGNSFRAWGDVDPVWHEFIESIVRCRTHLIATMRSKTEYVVETQGGKAVPRKVGMAPVMRDGAEYEFDIVAEMDLDHNLIVSKTRMMELDGEVINKPGPEFGERIRAWLSEGEEMPADKPRRSRPSRSGNGGNKRPASKKQLGYIRGLIDQKVLSDDPQEDMDKSNDLADAVRAALNGEKKISAERANAVIEKLKGLPDREGLSPLEDDGDDDDDLFDDLPDGPFDGSERKRGR